MRCYSSVIRRRVAVASAMFTRRAGAGITDAQRAGANGAQIKAQRFGLEGWSRSLDQGPEQGVQRLGDSKMRHCHFIAPALSHKHRCSRCAAVDPDMTAFFLIRSAYA